MYIQKMFIYQCICIYIYRYIACMFVYLSMLNVHFDTKNMPPDCSQDLEISAIPFSIMGI